MAKPIAVAKNIAFAFPNVCNTSTPGGPVPIPYPNIAQLSDATPVSNTGKELLVGGTHVIVEDSVVATSSGDEPAIPGTNSGKCEMTEYSGSVFYNGKGIVRFADQTSQNNGNAVGMVLSAEPSVMVGD